MSHRQAKLELPLQPELAWAGLTASATWSPGLSFLRSPGDPVHRSGTLRPFMWQQLRFLSLFALRCPQTSPPLCLCESLMKK